MNLLIAAALFLAAAPSFAADATLAKISGPVFYRTAGADRFEAAHGGEELIFGDSIRTGAGGIAHVVLAERGAVLVRENSQFTLEGTDERTLLIFKFGEFLVGLRRKLTDGQTFRVRTPSSVAAVRGTLFWGKTDEKRTTTYASFGHTIAVTAKGKTVLVHAGETTTIAFGRAPADAAPHHIPQSYLVDHFKVDDSLENLGELVDMSKPAPPSSSPAPVKK